MSVATICARCESPLEKGDLRCAICAEPVPFAQEERVAVEVRVLRCDGCGAAVNYDAQVQAPRCAFCDSVMHLETIEDPLEQTELWVPFTVEGAEAKRAVKSWLGSLGWFRPADLRSRAKVEEVRPLWWVGWVFQADALVSWAADSNAGAGRSSWAPHAGQTHLAFEDIAVSASRGLTAKETDALVPHYAVTTAVPDVAQCTPPAETTEEQFDVQRSQARARIAEAIRHLARARIEAGHVPGSSFRNVKVEPLLRGLSTRRYSFPAWVLAYRYEEKVYRAVVCGQDASCVVGKAPWSVARILLAVGGGLFVLAVLALVAMAVLAS